MKYEIGSTAELPPREEPRSRRTQLGGGNRGGGNGGRRNGGGGGGGGGDRSGDDNNIEQETFTPAKYRLTMWIILLVVVMTFAALAGAYIVISLNKQQEWQPFDLPFSIYFSTGLIILSSISYEIARRAINRSNQIVFKRWLLVTAALGAIFVGSQLTAWAALVNRGLYLAGNPYAGFFYLLTAAHAVHLVAGIGALGYIILRAWRPTKKPENLFKRQTATEVVGLYWHTLDALWLVLFALLIFWK